MTDEHIIKLLEAQNKQLDRIENLLKKKMVLGETGGKDSEKITSVKTRGKKSITRLIIELKNEKFFKEPKTSQDIVMELKKEGHHYSPNSLTWSLQFLVRKKELGRIMKDKIWHYVNR